jgi:hypothetical protein
MQLLNPKLSKYLWWVVLLPATIFSIIALWQLWTQYYQLSGTSRVVLLVIYSFLMAFILSDLGMFNYKAPLCTYAMTNYQQTCSFPFYFMNMDYL